MLIFSHFSTTNHQDTHNKKWYAIKHCRKAEEMHNKLGSKEKTTTKNPPTPKHGHDPFSSTPPTSAQLLPFQNRHVK